MFALIATMTVVDASAIARSYRAPGVVRAVAALLVLAGVVFASLWSLFAISYAVTDRSSLGAATLQSVVASGNCIPGIDRGDFVLRVR